MPARTLASGSLKSRGVAESPLGGRAVGPEDHVSAVSGPLTRVELN